MWDFVYVDIYVKHADNMCKYSVYKDQKEEHQKVL